MGLRAKNDPDGRSAERDAAERQRVELQRRHLAAIVESSEAAIVGTDIEGVVLSWNRGAERLFGYSAPEVIGRPITVIVPQEKHLEEREAFDRLRRGQPVDRREAFRRAKDGRLLVVSLTVSPMRDPDGKIAGAALVAHEVGERGNAGSALRSAREQLQVITDTMSVCVTRCGRDGRYQWISRAGAEWLGRAPEEIVGRPIAEVIGDEAYETIRPYVERVLSGERVEYEAHLNYRGIGPRWVNVVCEPVGGESGLPDGWIAVVTDITRRIEREQALTDADQRKNEFLATLAHELRNPLAALCNGLEILRLRDGDAAPPEWARGMMERQLQLMVRLIEDLLDLSRIARGKIELKKERVELAVVLRNAIETSRPLIERAGHELTIDLPAGPILVDADPVRLAQVFANLLNNAARYTPDGGTIHLEVEARADRVAVRVKDSGVGIPAHMLSQVFEMFTQVPRSPGESRGGLGIGLGIVRRLVEMHGGRVEACSAGAGQGSEFVVDLPVVRSAERPATIVPHAAASAHPRRILVADDSEDSAFSLARILQLMKNEVRIAHDGVEAVELAEAFRPEVILLDIGMPRLNGYDAARRIRERPWGADTLIVAVTGWGQEEDRRLSKHAGFDRHMVKPLELSAIEKLLASLPLPRA